MRRLTLTVTPEQAGRTVKSLLRRELHMADGAIARVKTVPDGICLNGAHARTIDRVAAGDVLTVRIDDKRSGGKFTPVAVPLDILYEDADLLALNKPAGMAVHGGYDRRRAHGRKRPCCLSRTGRCVSPRQPARPRYVGVMLVARSGYVHDRLRRVLHTGDFQRTYLAVACGTGLPPRGTIDLPIARADDGSTRRIPAPGGQPSVTDYTVLAERDGYTLLRVAPRTGRTHQIRVHFAALGHPLLGDALYGGEMSRLTRPALHSAAADFAQPVTGQSLHITAPIPRDLRAFDFERYL